jgi:hypothetical protein
MPSSWTGSSFTLFTGDPLGPGATESPTIAATFRYGSNECDSDTSDEFSVADERRGPGPLGHLTWDPAYKLRGGSFYSVALVRLEVSLQAYRWSVGTSDFIEVETEDTDPALYCSISKVQIVAMTTGTRPNRIVKWNSAEVTFIHKDGFFDTYQSHCLPRADNLQRRRTSTTSSLKDSHAVFAQYAEIAASTDDVTALRVVGQVTLCATDPPGERRLEPDHLQGKILVYTLPPEPEAPSAMSQQRAAKK